MAHRGQGENIPQFKAIRSGLLLVFFSSIIFLGGCGVRPGPKYYGVSLLQTERVEFGSTPFRKSLQDLIETGANTVALIPFLEQDSIRSDVVYRTEAVTDRQLETAIRHARKNGLQTVIKPQILVAGSWAGAITPGTPERWDKWFTHYTNAIVHYATLAEQEHVDLFVVGTELNQSVSQPQWQQLIEKVRQVYSGKITYAAHNIEGISDFLYWHMLDVVGVTMYPSLGPNADERQIRERISQTMRDLRLATERYGKPLWILELGISSIKGAQQEPWQWNHAPGATLIADTGLQATVLDLWLDALQCPLVDGLLLWCWYSDPEAGGLEDTDFTVQNKIGQRLLQYRWTQ